MSEKVHTFRSFIREWRARLAEADVPNGRASVEWVVEHVAGLTRAQLLSRLDHPVSSDVQEEARALLNRRLSREPLQYILERTEFYGLPFVVSPAVLIPRPETELLVDEAREALAPLQAPRVLDVGTGSGCIACAVKYHVPAARVVACDVSEAALEVARRNAAALGLEIDFHLADVFDRAFGQEVERVDLLVSNPPYVPTGEAATLEPEVVSFEPHVALFAGDDPLIFYRRLIKLSRALVRPGGFLLMEIHIDFAEEVAGCASSAGMEDVRIREDLSRRPRVVAARAPR